MQTLEITKNQAIELWKSSCVATPLKNIISNNPTVLLYNIKILLYNELVQPEPNTINLIISGDENSSILSIIFNDYIEYKNFNLEKNEFEIK